MTSRTLPTFPPLNRLKTNPISLRIWYPRLVEEASFKRLIDHLKHIKADRVFLIDAGYMDNYQLAPATLDERLPVLKKRIAQLKEEGILAGLNSGATIGHGYNMEGAERLMNLDWWCGPDGRPLVGIACPLGEEFGPWMERYFRGLAGTGAWEIFIDDDFRIGNHGAPAPGEWGCFCDLHLSEMKKRYGHTLTREELIAMIARQSSGRVQEDWLSLWKTNFIELLIRIERVVHEVNPNIRLGLMPVQNFIRSFGTDFLREAIQVVSAHNRPLLRTHDYHGLPHEIVPGSGLAAKHTAPPATEHLVEIENTAHNHHEYVRSPKTTRYAILSALGVGMGGAAPTFGDSEKDMPWERKYLEMYRANAKFFGAVADLTYRDTVLRGIPIRQRTYQRQVRYIDSKETIWKDAINEHPDLLAGMYGVAYQFDLCPVWLLDGIPASMTKKELDLTLDRGAAIDLAALQCLLRLGYGDRLGITVGERVDYRRGHRFLDHPLNGEYGGDINALRATFPVYRLEAAPGRYEEITEFVSWNGHRMAGGILVQKEGVGRNVILPHVLSLNGEYMSGIVNTQYRRLMRRLLAFCLGEPLKLGIETPPQIAPYYFERGDGAVIVTLLNAYYDDVYDFDLVLGDGGRLQSKKIYRVMPDGSIKHRPSLKIRRTAEGSYALRIDRPNTLENCDVLVLMIA